MSGFSTERDHQGFGDWTEDDSYSTDGLDLDAVLLWIRAHYGKRVRLRDPDALRALLDHLRREGNVR